ncbi:hypothetical protein PMI42_04819 [Bradyrhizobium sp. YR681]|uniref:hypothetical protein n=1 Tax=Bradyrhizobium sp. YR681 TaxID=1144344 RepID=UPI0002710D19|nr:hypothetical protein [Bradyrhizobium sp. YR681]EJN11805.1 hypothetical protein PMI42_04819 [Bradyrhizobium sp. YR681]
MTSAEHERRRLIERNALRGYRAMPSGPSKADMQRDLEQAVRNTAATPAKEEQT